MKCLLYVHSGPLVFIQESVHDLYIDALTSGQSHGHGQFFIDTKSRVPSRDTQLGLADNTYIKQPKTSYRVKRNKLLDQD